MADFFNLLNPMLWMLAGGILVLIVFILILFKWLIGKKY